MAKERLDQRIVRDGFADSRSRAQGLIRAQKVKVNGVVISKTGHAVEETDIIILDEADHPYVSRGGLKLAKALLHWQVDVSGLRCLDIGSSTGGFTDCLLQHGAQSVIAVDVGTDQLHPKLRKDARVEFWEKTHIKNFGMQQLKQAVNIVVMDLSFISLKQVLPFAVPLLASGGKIIALLKPQFELGPQSLNSRGIVKEPLLYEALGKDMQSVLQQLGFLQTDLIESPLQGGDGNREFLLYGVRA